MVEVYWTASINTTQIYADVSKERTYKAVNGFYE
jgi:hypothetical protein